jgi:hypothetical protein
MLIMGAKLIKSCKLQDASRKTSECEHGSDSRDVL